MKNNPYDVHYFLRRGKMIVFLFCLNLLFLIIGFLFLLITSSYSQPITIAFFLLSALTVISILPLLITNFAMIKNADHYLINNSSFKDLNRIKIFHKLLDENLFEYHFQPIIKVIAVLTPYEKG